MEKRGRLPQKIHSKKYLSIWKIIFGENIKAKINQDQQVEITLKSIILNKMANIGIEFTSLNKVGRPKNQPNFIFFSSMTKAPALK